MSELCRWLLPALCKAMPLVALVCLIGASCDSSACAGGLTKGRQPSIEDYATVESVSDGVPVYSFSELCYVYGVSPDFLPRTVMQEGNTNPVKKVQPKKSWEIKSNYLGCETELTPRSAWNDNQPFLPIHLIDGNRDTLWCSWGCYVPDGPPEWIRIDLAMESTVSSVALVEGGPDRWNYGRCLPTDIEVKLSKDGWHWETVYEKKCLSGDPSGVTVLKFEPRLAKQIWITGSSFEQQAGQAIRAFSIAEVEVRDPSGDNLALASRGAGVSTSSTSSTMLADRFTQDALWGPLQYDLGNKWTRVGPDNGSFTWNYVEHEKGKLKIDPKADAAITECVKNGLDVIMVLDYKGNWIYQNPPTRTNWKESRSKEINNYYESPSGVATDSPEMFKAYLRYVDYMVRHFRDRVTYFEIGNEWNVNYNAEQYIKEIFWPTYKRIKKLAPNARIIMGSTNDIPLIFDCLGQATDSKGKKNPIEPGVAKCIDAIGVHVGGEPNQGYANAIRGIKKRCEELGFKGRFMATEIYCSAAYPPGPPDSPSEVQQAKYFARSAAVHSGLDMQVGFCHTHITGYPNPQGITRRTWPSQTSVPVQPSVAYYVWRNVATATDGFHAAEFPVKFSSDKELIDFTFRRGDNELMTTVWLPTKIVEWTTGSVPNPGAPPDHVIVETRSDVTFPGVRAKEAWVVDIMNGTEQELKITRNGADTVIKNVLVKDYPTFVRISL